MSKTLSIPQQARALVAPVEPKYRAALQNAHLAAMTTDTQAWQQNYLAEIDKHNKFIKARCAEIALATNDILLLGVSESREKVIKDAVKLMSDERIRHAAWIDRAVYQYSSTVDECNRIMSNLVSQARSEERSHPLVSRDLGDAVQGIVDEWPRPTWEESTGRINILGDAQSFLSVSEAA